MKTFLLCGARIRAFSVPNDPLDWFCLADICAAIGVKNPSTTAKSLSPERKQMLSLKSGKTGAPKMLVVDLGGLMQVICRGRSAEAERIFLVLCRWGSRIVWPDLFGSCVDSNPSPFQLVETI